MMSAKKVYLLSLIFAVFVMSCESRLNPTTHKNTYHDNISDITFLNDLFFTTNYDLSANSWEQIDLIVMGLNENGIYLDNKFSLGLNGQGYFLMTNDGSDLYLQSRTTQLIFKSSSIGELSYSRYDSIGTHWLPSGITYNPSIDSLITIYRNQNINNQYRLRLLSKSISETSHRDEIFEINDIDSENHGVFCLSFSDSKLYMLAVKNNEDILLTVDYDNLEILESEMIGDSTAVGIDILNNSVYLSYRDRRIEKFKDIE